MTTQIALLRAINLGGNTKVAMPDLVRWLTDLGMGRPRTLLQTGNLVFQSPSAVGSELEGLLETEADKRLGLHTDFFVREVDEWLSVVERNPFAKAALDDPSHLVVVFLTATPKAAAVQALDAAAGPERVSAWDRHLFATYPKGIGRSRLTMALIERKVGTRGTARNWNTVLKLAALASG